MQRTLTMMHVSILFFISLFYKLFVQLLRMRHEHHPRLCSNYFLLNLNDDTVNIIVHEYAHYEHANREINGHCIFNVLYECNNKFENAQDFDLTSNVRSRMILHRAH